MQSPLFLHSDIELMLLYVRPKNDCEQKVKTKTSMLDWLRNVKYRWNTLNYITRVSITNRVKMMRRRVSEHLEYSHNRKSISRNGSRILEGFQRFSPQVGKKARDTKVIRSAGSKHLLNISLQKCCHSKKIFKNSPKFKNWNTDLFSSLLFELLVFHTISYSSQTKIF